MYRIRSEDKTQKWLPSTKSLSTLFFFCSGCSSHVMLELLFQKMVVISWGQELVRMEPFWLIKQMTAEKETSHYVDSLSNYIKSN